jgi:hypothetical protein
VTWKTEAILSSSETLVDRVTAEKIVLLLYSHYEEVELSGRIHRLAEIGLPLATDCLKEVETDQYCKMELNRLLIL